MPRPRVRRKPGKPPAAKSGETGGRKLYAIPSVKPLAARPTIVGVGASAGGLEAFSTLLQSLSPNPDVAIVFVQHLAPQHESALVSLLSGQTAMRHGRRAESRLRDSPERPDDHRRTHAPLERAPRRSHAVHPRRHVLRVAGRVRRAASHRHHPVGHGVRRRAGRTRDQSGRRRHDGAGSCVGEVRRHAPRRHCNRDGRPRVRPERHRREAHRPVAPCVPERRGQSDVRVPGERGGTARDLRPAAAGQRHRFPPLQAPDHQTPSLPADGASSSERCRTVRPAASRRCRGITEPVPGSADPRHQVFSRA